ncbi:MAG: bifunctional serine/threonine-protein kinase/formylglycine-generating enzyme family protein [Planctomycetota bacterium]
MTSPSSRVWATFSGSGSVLDGLPLSSHDSRRFSGGLPLPEEALRELAARYEVLQELGRGAMGVVYRARDRTLGRDVAVKVLRDGGTSSRQLARFQREGELAAAIDHPGVVRVFGAGRVAGCPYLAYELVEGGRSLAEAIEHASLERRLELVAELARGLGAAHAQGIVHRDVKPANVLVDPQGKVRLTDFGLATAKSGERLTKTGSMLGTPLFMAPELVRGQREQVGPWTDVWAVGVLLYACVADELPFEGGDMLSLGGQICSGQFTPLRQLKPDVDPLLDAVVLRALKVDPRQRFADGDALADVLEQYLRGELRAPPRGPRFQLGVRGALALALLAAGVGAALTQLGRAGTPPPAAPTLELVQALPPWTIRDTVELEVLPTGVDPLRLTGPGGFTRCEAGRPVRLEAPLRVGVNRLDVVLSDARGEQVALAVEVERLDVPGWLVETPPEQRPPLPLPAGITAEATPGDYRHAKSGALLRWVPPATFAMGSDADDVSKQYPPSPQHRVTITRGFFLGKFETTQAEWWRYCQDAGLDPPPVVTRGPEFPVTVVNHEQARAYCAWAGGRLPTEAEWELAARGTDGRVHTWGNNPDEAWRANLDHPDDGYAGMAPVGSFPSSASPYGCQDMLGNVWEFCADKYGPYGPQHLTDPSGPRDGIVNPTEPELGEWRVSRGGAWTSTAAHYVYSRSIAGELHATAAQGLRLCVPISPRATPSPPAAR